MSHEARFEIGPGPNKDIRERRPYFLLPLLELTSAQETTDRIEVMAGWVKAAVLRQAAAEPAKTRVTDVYVFSHGWHRNFFAAVAAYDRLFSRFVGLFRRGKLEPVDGTAFVPVFVALHWHSDPHQDHWVDDSGRRHLASFLENARAGFSFRPGTSDAQFLDDFERLYQLLTQMAAPGSDALSDPGIAADAGSLLDDIDRRYEIRGGPGATATEKAAVVWTCYHEAQVKRVLLSQGEKARAFGGPGTALRALVKFAAAGGLMALVLQQFGGQAKAGLADVWGEFWTWYTQLPLVDRLAGLWEMAPSWPTSGDWRADLVAALMGAIAFVWKHALFGWLLFFPLAAAGMLLLYGMARWESYWRDAREKQHRAREAVGAGFGFLALLFWLPAQLFLTAPVLVYLAITYFLGGMFAGVITLLHRERATIDGPARRNSPSFRETAAVPARWPVAMLKRACPRESIAGRLAAALDNQLAFFEMQRKAVSAGEAAGEVIHQVVSRLKLLGADPEIAALGGGAWDPRVHLIGHSFGGSVVLNAARRLAALPVADRPNVHSISLLQAAVASGWLQGETQLQDMVSGAIACCYSGYDLANGFYYPFGNNSRMAAGYVGLVGDSRKRFPIFLGAKGEYATLVTPPPLGESIRRILAWRQQHWPNQPAQQGGAVVLNVDCSRFVYEGNPLLGGGHGDIFKNDIVHLIWAVTTL